MGYWKCSCELYFHPVMRELQKQIHGRDGFMAARESIFFKLLSYCANGHQFESADQFSRFSCMPLKQCEVVWNICIEKNVLRRGTEGFTAIDWMSENNLLPEKTHKTPRLARQVTEASVCTPCHETTQNGAVLGKQTAIPMPRKRQVRNNVYLTDAELATLQKSFSDADLNEMLDYLSAYKLRSHRFYRSDFDAINRWVIGWLRAKQDGMPTDDENVARYYKKRVEEQTQSELPDWMTTESRQ